MRRMDRYKDEDINRSSRIDKNQELYQNFSSNTIYTNITDVTNANAFEIKNNDESLYKSRESYQQMRKYQDVEPLPRSKKELEDVNYLMQKSENKVYDINSVIEEARKNRQEKDELEEKRKLKNAAYNILSDNNKKELEKYREEKKKRMTTPEEEEIRELIDTIASKTLAGEIDKATSVDLLSDLMATNVLDKVEAVNQDEEDDDEEPVLKEVIEVEESITEEDDDEQDEENTEKLTSKEKFAKKDSDFYTRSMDLSDKDFNFSDDFRDKQMPLVLKILIFIVVVAIVAVAAYFIHQKIM